MVYVSCPFKPMDPINGTVTENPQYGLRFELEGCVMTSDVSPTGGFLVFFLFGFFFFFF